MTRSLSRPAPLRWIVAILVTIAMLVGTTGVAVFAQSGSSGGPVFAPAASVGYGELRLDLPGDQQESLAAFMAHFPGFADQASFETKLEELLDQVVSSSSGGGATWTGNIEPWSNGQLAVALLGLPDMSTSSSFGPQDPPEMVLAFGVADRTALEAQLATFLTQEPIGQEEYQGATITIVGDDISYAVTDSYLLAAPAVDQVKASLDVLAGAAPSLAEDSAFGVAAARVPANRLAAFYFSTAALVPLLEQQLASQPGAELVLQQLDQIPAWVSGYTQVGSDRLIIAGDVQYPASVPVPTLRESDLASRFPAGQLAWFEVRDVGETFHTIIEQTLAQVEAMEPGSTAQLAQIERILGVPVEELLDPVEDLAIGVWQDADGRFAMGIGATLTDEAAARQRVTTLLALARMGLANAPITVTQTDVEGIEVTTFGVEDAGGMGAMPIDPSVSIALGDGHLFIGIGDFAAAAITRDAATSLASDARYQDALAIAGSPNAGLVWVDIAAIQSTIESMGLADAEYTTEVKPWLDALDQVVVSSTSDEDGIVSGQLVLLVR
ncbi:MAG: DUF3352 domain-containing protein [Chloroflexi bacterium]|nr:DUF3352 domain-containing protein [Chloroflexota bacterium]